jgi:signal recognition particle subunit SRP54
MSKLFKSMGSGMTGGMKAQQRLLSQMQGKQRFGR